jgi:uncharacterized membrane protein YfcA
MKKGARMKRLKESLIGGLVGCILGFYLAATVSPVIVLFFVMVLVGALIYSVLVGVSPQRLERQESRSSEPSRQQEERPRHL